jgi:hypothetical protein
MAELTATFTAAQARHASLSSRDLNYLVREGVVVEISRGVYRDGTALGSAHLDLLAVHARVPKAVVCGQSALALHQLIDDIPAAVHIAVARGARRPTISYPQVVVAQYSPDTFGVGIEEFEAAPGEDIPVYGAARSVVDAMRHRGRVGESLALSALARYLRVNGYRGVTEVQDVAEQLHALPLIQPVLNAILALASTSDSTGPPRHRPGDHQAPGTWRVPPASGGPCRRGGPCRAVPHRGSGVLVPAPLDGAAALASPASIRSGPR